MSLGCCSDQLGAYKNQLRCNVMKIVLLEWMTGLEGDGNDVDF